MRIVSLNTLATYWQKHPETRASLQHWVRLARAAKWQSAQEVASVFSKSKALNGERVRFEVVGGDYRLIVAFHFPSQIAFVKFVGTHAEYDRVDALTVSLF